MRIRTFVGILLALVVVVAASYLTHLNSALLHSSFRLGGEDTVPAYVALLGVFLLGFLPPVAVLLVQTLRRDLAVRRERRRRRESQSLQGSFRRAVDLQADGQWRRAAEELEAFLAEQPEDFAGLLRLGEVLRREGRGDDALEVHRRASVLYPQSVALLYQLADDYDTRGEERVAREIRDRVLRDFPGLGLHVLRQSRNAALAGEDWLEASRLEERIESLLTEAGEADELAKEAAIRRGLTYQRGVGLLAEERVEEARAVFQGLVAAEPLFIPAAIMLGESELLADDEAGALAAWRRGFAATGSPVFLQRIEDHFIEREKPIEAIENLRSLIASTANDLLPRFFLGRLYHRLEMHEEALKVLSGLSDRIESSPTYHLLLARIHERRGEMRKAVDSYLACIRETGIGAAEYVCRQCGETYPDWRDRCPRCGAWNSIELDFEEEKISAEVLGLRPVPIWTLGEDDTEVEA